MTQVEHDGVSFGGAASGHPGGQPGSDEFARLYEQWRPALVALCRRQTCGHGDAEALAQEAFIRAWKSWGTYSPNRPFWPWVAAIARNLAVTEGMLARRRSERLAEVSSWLFDRPQSGDHDADEIAQRHTVRTALRKLSARHRRLLELRDLEGWTYEEMAHLEGVSVESIRGSLKRARSNFRMVYERLEKAVFGGVVAGAQRFGRRWARLSRAVDDVGGRLPRWFGNDMAAALLALVVAAPGVGAAGSADIRTRSSPEVIERVATAPSVARPADAATGTASTAASSDGGVPASPSSAAVAPSEPARAPATLDASITAFTVSPSYDRDRTVYASGTEDDCAIVVSCPVLYRSTDGGATWERLPATGRSGGSVLLPPSYPDDPRIFSVPQYGAVGALEVSADGGQTFSLLAPLAGHAVMSPRFSSGDPRIFIGAGSLGSLAGQTGFEYVDGIGLRTLGLGLPEHVSPTSFAFSPTYADDGVVLVGGMLNASAALGVVTSSSVYRCVGTTPCREVARWPHTVPPTVVMPRAANGAVLAWTPYALYRSDDAGRSFHEIARPHLDPTAYIASVDTALDGRVFVSTEGPGSARTWVADGRAESWRQVSDEASLGALNAFTVLPDGTILVARRGRPGVLCSDDDGSSWSGACRH